MQFIDYEEFQPANAAATDVNIKKLSFSESNDENNCQKNSDRPPSAKNNPVLQPID